MSNMHSKSINLFIRNSSSLWWPAEIAKEIAIYRARRVKKVCWPILVILKFRERTLHFSCNCIINQSTTTVGRFWWRHRPFDPWVDHKGVSLLWILGLLANSTSPQLFCSQDMSPPAKLLKGAVGEPSDFNEIASLSILNLPILRNGITITAQAGKEEGIWLTFFHRSTGAGFMSMSLCDWTS